MKWTTAIVCAAGIAIAGAAESEVVAPDAVVVNDDFEISESLTGSVGDATKGAKWFADRKLGNCLACHANSDQSDQPFHGEIGPEMDGVGDRYSEGMLRAIVANSKSVFGDATIMPGFYSLDLGDRVAPSFQGSTILSAEQVEDVVAYLMSLKE